MLEQWYICIVSDVHFAKLCFFKGFLVFEIRKNLYLWKILASTKIFPKSRVLCITYMHLLKSLVHLVLVQDNCGKIPVVQSIFCYFKQYFLNYVNFQAHEYHLNVICIWSIWYMICSLFNVSFYTHVYICKWICMKLYTSLYGLIIYVNVRVQLVYSTA